MKKQVITEPTFSIVVYMIIIGVGVGWLIGLSVSPVVSTVLTSITGSIAAIIAALGGLNNQSVDANETNSQKRDKLRISPLPLASFVFGIILGSILGLLIRNHHIFGSDVSSEIVKWTALDIPREQVAHRLFDTYYPQPGFVIPYSQTLNAEIDKWVALDLPKEEVVRRLFDRQHPPEVKTNSSNGPIASREGGSILYSVSTEECDSLLAAVTRANELNDEQQLILALDTSPNKGLQRLTAIVPNPATVRQLVEEVLCAAD